MRRLISADLDPSHHALPASSDFSHQPVLCGPDQPFSLLLPLLPLRITHPPPIPHPPPKPTCIGASHPSQPSLAGATNAHSTCVRRGLEHALQTLRERGEIAKLRTKWLPPRGCSFAAQQGLEAGDGTSDGDESGDGDASGAGGETSGDGSRRRRRRLKSGSGGGGTTTAGTSSSVGTTIKQTRAMEVIASL